MYIFLIIMISYFQAGLLLDESALTIFFFSGPEDHKPKSKPKIQIVKESKFENMKTNDLKGGRPSYYMEGTVHLYYEAFQM